MHLHDNGDDTVISVLSAEPWRVRGHESKA